MTERVPCRFFAQGYCAFGDGCRFFHDNTQATPAQHGNGHAAGNQQVCRFYMNGHCAFGDSCRNLHPANGQQGGAGRGGQGHRSDGATAGRSGSSARQGGSSGNGDVPAAGDASAAPNWDDFMDPDEMDEFERWQAEQLDLNLQQQMGGGWEDVDDPAEVQLCDDFKEAGCCAAGDECPFIHGDRCTICLKFVIHPYNPDLAEHHKSSCQPADGAASEEPPKAAAPSSSPAAEAADADGAKQEAAQAADEVAETLEGVSLESDTKEGQ